MDNKTRANQWLETCLKKGADAAEVYLESGRSLSVEVRNGAVETVEESSTQGVGFRIFVKGRMAMAGSNDLREEALDGAIARAVEFARVMSADENNLLPGPEASGEVAGLYDPQIARLSLEEKIRLAVQTEKLAMTDKRITKSAGASYGESEEELVIANSLGVRKSYRSTGCYFGVGVVAEKGDQKSSGFQSCRRRFFTDLKKPEEVAARAARDAYEMLDPRMVKTQRAAVIFDPEVARVLLGGILGAIHGERVLQGASFLAKKLGQKIGSELLTVYDDGLLPKGISSRPFDGEGVPTQKRLVVDRGTLQGFLYNAAVARRAGVKSTGNASRSGFDSLPGIGSHNFYLAAGTAEPGQILADTRKGLWLKEVTGYGINPVNGQFSGGASGFWLENGKVAFPVKGLTVAGTAEEIFFGIDALGSDLDLSRGTTTPTFRVRELQIGGE